ncbi:hypothetical protein DER45DRAFT_588820 [Fusarium avenaceum]|nr:hypothetical protein DER45DRAFT_588820 [Fusarium avenaceum]
MSSAIEIISIYRKVNLRLTYKDVKEGIDDCYNKQRVADIRYAPDWDLWIVILIVAQRRDRRKIRAWGPGLEPELEREQEQESEPAWKAGRRQLELELEEEQGQESEPIWKVGRGRRRQGQRRGVLPAGGKYWAPAGYIAEAVTPAPKGNSPWPYGHSYGAGLRRQREYRLRRRNLYQCNCTGAGVEAGAGAGEGAACGGGTITKKPEGVGAEARVGVGLGAGVKAATSSPWRRASWWWQ